MNDKDLQFFLYEAFKEDYGKYYVQVAFSDLKKEVKDKVLICVSSNTAEEFIPLWKSEESPDYSSIFECRKKLGKILFNLYEEEKIKLPESIAAFYYMERQIRDRKLQYEIDMYIHGNEFPKLLSNVPNPAQSICKNLLSYY